MPMKLKVQHVMDATIVVSQIIREDRKLPQKGKYRLARLQTKLAKEFETFNAQRDAAIKVYNYRAMIPNPENQLPDGARQAMVESGHIDKLPPKEIEDENFSVPPDKIEEFQKTWGEIATGEIEVDIDPIPLDQLCFPGDLEDGSITAHEFIILGDLVKE